MTPKNQVNNQPLGKIKKAIYILLLIFVVPTVIAYLGGELTLFFDPSSTQGIQFILGIFLMIWLALGYYFGLPILIILITILFIKWLKNR